VAGESDVPAGAATAPDRRSRENDQRKDSEPAPEAGVASGERDPQQRAQQQQRDGRDAPPNHLEAMKNILAPDPGGA
jgi:hypothetical protein